MPNIEWRPVQIFEEVPATTPPPPPACAPTRSPPGTSTTGCRARSDSDAQREQDSPGRQRRKKVPRPAANAQPARQAATDAPDASPPQAAAAQNARAAGPAPAEAEEEDDRRRQAAAADKPVAAQQVHSWIMEALDRCGLERVRGVEKDPRSVHEVRLPERLRQQGSKLTGRWYVRSKVQPTPQPAAAVPKDFQMKATLDQESYDRMMALAIEYNLFQRARGNLRCAAGSHIHVRGCAEHDTCRDTKNIC